MAGLPLKKREYEFTYGDYNEPQNSDRNLSEFKV